jgi:hypothetical protein
MELEEAAALVARRAAMGFEMGQEGALAFGSLLEPYNRVEGIGARSALLGRNTAL